MLLQGTVKFIHDAGFCFVKSDDGIDDYVHPGALRRAGISNLKIGDRLEYQRIPSRKHAAKFEAADIRRIDKTEQAATFDEAA
jgi:cold shock CspA family protein